MRSFLFVPADSPRKIEKSRSAEADALILDLEDAVAMPRKEAARALAREALQAARGRQQVYVRVNAFDTGLLPQDLGAVMAGRPDGLVLPKCASGDEVRRLAHMLDGAEAALGLPPGATRIVAVATETPQAVLSMASYAGCSPRLWGLMWGGEDLAGALGASANREAGAYRSPFRLARDLCLLGAAAAGVQAIDAVFTDVGDVEGLAQEARQARIDGFGAKAAIHPAQCAPIHAAFAPTAAELTWARAVLDALAAQDAGAGVVLLDGQMVDRPHAVQARRILARGGVGQGGQAPGGPGDSGAPAAPGAPGWAG